MDHSEYVRILPEADIAVLFIHGICGSPNQFRGILPLEELVPRNWSVYNMVLDGHCKGVKDFSDSSMKKWKAQVWEVFQTLSQSHKKVILVSHSMGTLFSIQLSREFPEKIPVLFLLNVPLKVGVRLFGVCNLIRIAFQKVDPSDPIQASMANATGIATTKRIWQYIPWLARILELFGEICKTRKCVSSLCVPTIAFQSQKDEMVSNYSAKILSRSSCVELHNLQNSTHFYYAPQDAGTIKDRFVACLKTIQ